MTDIVEIFWNARPHLKCLGIKVGSGALDPRADEMFSKVRAAAAEAFPGSVTLVRIAVRREPDSGLRIRRAGVAADLADHQRLRTLIDTALERCGVAAS